MHCHDSVFECQILSDSCLVRIGSIFWKNCGFNRKIAQHSVHITTSFLQKKSNSLIFLPNSQFSLLLLKKGRKKVQEFRTTSKIFIQTPSKIGYSLWLMSILLSSQAFSLFLFKNLDRKFIVLGGTLREALANIKL